MVAAQQTREPLLLTARDVARRLQIGRNLAYQMVNDGTLPVIIIGKRKRVPMNALEKWIAAQMRAAKHLRIN